MGFMIMQCGLSLFPIALLHIVAHSLYKAHAFLGSGAAVKAVLASRKLGPVAIPGAKAVAYAFILALCLYALIGAIFGFGEKSPQEIALGAILIFGVAYLFAQGFADAAPKALTRRTTLYAVLASVSYFILQIVAKALTSGALPHPLVPGPLEWALMVLAIVSFGVVAIAQATFPLWANHPAAAGLRVHLQNGFYVNTVLDRSIQGWLTHKRA
jgi:NAD(P)H-quinone oxidoreductase subunit 5